MLKIRKLSPRDLPQILEISQVSFTEPLPKKSEFEKLYQKHPNESIVADDNGKVAGFIIGKISGDQGTIKLIAVSPDYRGKGVGKGLMEYILKHFAEKKIKEVMAHSRIHNKAGCDFLKSFGFEIIKTVENYYLNGDYAYLMKKDL